MPQGKVFSTPQAALSDIHDGSTILVSGFAGCGVAERLLAALLQRGTRNLTIICGDTEARPGTASYLIDLVASGQVCKLISPLPYSPGKGGPMEERWQAGHLDIEAVPQGILIERLRAGGAGIGGVFLPTAVGTRFETGKEKRPFVQGDAVLELPLKADYAFIRVVAADTLGNAVYEGATRNWAPVMAMAARVTIAEADRVVEPGDLDPEAIISPGIFVNRIVAAG